MPLIMPPVADAASPVYRRGPGSAFKRDAYALGLLIAGLVRCKNTTTQDMYTDNELRNHWEHPSPELQPALRSMVLGLVDINPVKRLPPATAESMLPPPQQWFLNV